MAVYSTLSSQQFSQSCLLYFRLAGKALAAGHKQQESNSDHQAPYYSNPFGSTKSSIAACRQNYLSTGILCTHTYIYIHCFVYKYIYIYVCCVYIYIMSGGQNSLLLAMDMAKVGGPLSVVKVCTSILCVKILVSVSGWSSIACEGFHANLKVPSPLPTLVFC